MPEYTSILYSVILCKQSELQITVLDQKITKSCFLNPPVFYMVVNRQCYTVKEKKKIKHVLMCLNNRTVDD